MFAISFFAPPVHQLFLQFIEAESNVGRFLLMILCSLVVGLEVSVVRWIVFEQILCRKYKRDKSIYRHLSTDSKLSAFRAAVDEYYRYHQFWGGMAVVTPFIAWGLVSQTSKAPAHWLAGTFAVLEIINISGGWSAYKNYIDSANKILGVSGHGERLGTEQGRTRNQAPSLSSTPATSSASAPSKASAPPPTKPPPRPKP